MYSSSKMNEISPPKGENIDQTKIHNPGIGITENTKKDLLKSSIIINKDQDEDTTIWSSITGKLSLYTNNFYYNVITTKNNVDIERVRYIRLFDRVFDDKDIQSGKLNKYLHTIFHMTYRSSFTPMITSTGTEFTSDCGWGCMIRTAQMMLAKAIFEYKVNKHVIANNLINNDDIDNLVGNSLLILSDDAINELREETLLLFFDNSLKLEDIKGNRDFLYLFENIPKVLSEAEQEEIERKRKIAEQNDEIWTNSQYLTCTESSGFYVKGVNAPFSIQNICSVSESFDIKAGEWFSDVMMIKIFIELNKQFHTLPDIELMHFTDGYIDESMIIEKCFQEVRCLDENENEKKVCIECNEQSSKYLKRGNHFYKFSKGGFIFVSVRLGLSNLEEDYIPTIPQIFKIPFNLGIIGGKTNKALFFIGECMGNLVYLDPHINQISIPDKESLRNPSNFSSYSIQSKINKIDIASISPAFTTAFFFNSLQNYLQLIEGLALHNSFIHPIFKFQEQKVDEIKRMKTLEIDSKNRKVRSSVENTDEGFCIVDFEDDEL